MADLKNWQKLDIGVKTSLITNVEEADKDAVWYSPLKSSFPVIGISCETIFPRIPFGSI